VPFSEPNRLPALLTSAAGSALLAALGGAALGTALAAKPLAVAALLAVLFGLLAAVVALRNAAAAFVGLVLLIALVPTYAGPAVGPLLLVPSAAAAWLVAGTIAWRNAIQRGRLFRPNVIDWAAAAFALLMLVSIGFSRQVNLQEYLHVMLLWAGPYLAARLLLAEVDKPAPLVAFSFALAILIVAPFAIAEALGASNVFHALDFNSTEFSVWANQLNRFGRIRAVASFGHPIAFSMFAATSGLLSLAMGIRSTKLSHRYGWYALAALAVGVQALALSRTGWLILAIGAVMIAALTVQGSIRRRLTTLLGISVAVVLLTSLAMPKELAILPGFQRPAEAGFAGSGQYRQALLDRALEPGVLHLWGNPVNRVTPFVSGSTATDNAYIILADAWGLIPTAALILVAVAMFVPLARGFSRDTGGLSVLPVVAFTGLVALFFVAFITQQQSMIWLLVGAAAVATERIPRGARNALSRAAWSESDDSTSSGSDRTR
jgi:hypothetical protein